MADQEDLTLYVIPDHLGMVGATKEDAVAFGNELYEALREHYGDLYYISVRQGLGTHVIPPDESDKIWEIVLDIVRNGAWREGVVAPVVVQLPRWAVPVLRVLDEDGNVQRVVDELCARIRDGVTRPGSWERPWVQQAFGDEFVGRLEADPDASWRQRPPGQAGGEPR